MSVPTVLSGLTVGDFDGDGLSDVLYRPSGSTGLSVRVSGGTSFAAATQWLADADTATPWLVGDVNGDGRDDLVHAVAGAAGAVEAFLSTGTGFTSAGIWGSTGTEGAELSLGDFNGDGKADLLWREPAAAGASVLLSNGAGFDAASRWTTVDAGDEPWYVGDFNGDGSADVFRYLPGQTGAEVYFSTGTDFQVAGDWTGSGHGPQLWALGDFNGDGKTDVFANTPYPYSPNVLLSNGAFFAGGTLRSGSTLALTSGFQTLDFNGDGLADLVSGDGYLLLNHGTYFSNYGNLQNVVGEKSLHMPSVVYTGTALDMGDNLNLGAYSYRVLDGSTGALVADWSTADTLSLDARFSAGGIYRLQISQKSLGAVVADEAFTVAEAAPVQGAIGAIGRFDMVRVNSEVAAMAKVGGYASGFTSFQELFDHADAQFTALNYVADPSRYTDTDTNRALFLLQWVSGLWGYGNALAPDQPGRIISNEVSGTVPTELISPSLYFTTTIADCQDYAAMTAYFMTMAGYTNQIVYTPGHVFNEVLIGGQWWTFDANLNLAFRSAYENILDTSQAVELFDFTKNGNQIGSDYYRSIFDSFYLKDLLELANGTADTRLHLSTYQFLHSLRDGFVYLDAMGITEPPVSDPPATQSVRSTSPYLPEAEFSYVRDIDRLEIISTDDAVAAVAQTTDFRPYTPTLSELHDHLAAAYLGSPASTTFAALADQSNRAIFMAQWVAGAWHNNFAPGSATPGEVVDFTQLLGTTSSPGHAVAAVLGSLLSREGVDVSYVELADRGLVQAFLDGRWMTFDLSFNRMYEGSWSDVVNAGQNINVYEFAYDLTGEAAARSVESVFMISSGLGNDYTLSDFQTWAESTNSPSVFPTGFYARGEWTTVDPGTQGWSVGDFNGDGKDDVFRYVRNVAGADMYLSDGTQFVSKGNWVGAGQGAEPWYVGDFNGDGKDDIFRYMLGSSGAEVFLSNGSAFLRSGSWTGAGHGKERWYVGDFNGDGKDDIFRYMPGTSGADVFLSNGKGFVRSGSWTAAGHGTEPWYIGDFNGDGKDDIARYLPNNTNVEVFLSTGKAFKSAGVWGHLTKTQGTLQVGDYNGDGKDDLYRDIFGSGDGEILFSGGAGFTSATATVVASDNHDKWLVGDFLGNGRSDLIHTGLGGTSLLIPIIVDP